MNMFSKTGVGALCLAMCGIVTSVSAPAASASAPGDLTSADLSHVASANSWLTAQTATSTTITTTSTVSFASQYPASYLGAINGTFVLRDRTYPIENMSSISVTNPSVVTDSYRGVITGKVLVSPTPNRWIIQAYKKTPSGTSQVPVQAVADGTTGGFSIDVSSVPTSTAGSWVLGILDASNSYAPYGSPWPTLDDFTGLQVQQLLVANATYFWASTPANTDGTFSFPNSNTGTKMLRLVDISSKQVLAENVPLTGLIRSFKYLPKDPEYGTSLQDRTFVYDQALALTAAIASGNTTQARLLVTGLLQMQTTSGTRAGGFVFGATQLSPSSAEPFYRTGAHAIAVDALLTYIAANPSDPARSTYTAAAVAGLKFLIGTRSTSGATQGLFRGGYGDTVGTPPKFDPTITISWASTEHNLDAWQLLRHASVVLGNTSVNYSTMASQLDGTMQAKLWNSTANRFNQGINSGGPDTADPLDVSSWGAIQLNAAHHTADAAAAIGHLSVFTITRNGINGYVPFNNSPGYPNATPTLWFEGSFGAMDAFYRTGDTTSYRALLDGLSAGQKPDGAFGYATDADTQYGITTAESVASTAWFVIATVGRSLMWNS